MWEKTDFVLAGIGDDRFYMDHPGMTWAMGLFGLFWLAVLALIVVGLVLLARNFDQVGAGRRERDSARFILDERYAHGEIDQDEYLARKRHLP